MSAKAASAGKRLWLATCSLVEHLADKETAKLQATKGPAGKVKQIEVIDRAVRQYAAGQGLTESEIDEICRTPPKGEGE